MAIYRTVQDGHPAKNASQARFDPGSPSRRSARWHVRLLAPDAFDWCYRRAFAL
jgi:hypothetical protein